MGWAALAASIGRGAPYLGGILWTIGYDTIYAHQDKEDDALIGVRRRSLRSADATLPLSLRQRDGHFRGAFAASAG
jgi:4-hydroxybenzoate polyprenyltransferase